MPPLMTIASVQHKSTGIIFRLLDHCDILSIVSLLKTSSALSRDTKAYCHEVWNIDRSLITWFASPSSFRATLLHCDAVVHGPVIDHFLDRRMPFTSLTSITSLDIVLNVGGLTYMGTWLLKAGYEMIKGEAPNIETIHELAGFRSFSQIYARRNILQQYNRLPNPRWDVSMPIMFQHCLDPQRRVGVTVSLKEPVYHVLKSNTSGSDNKYMYCLLISAAAHMNYLTGQATTCLFPALTFINCVALSLHPTSDDNGNLQPWVQYVEDRGVTTLSPINAYLKKAGGRRHVRDKHCWIIGNARLCAYPQPNMKTDSEPATIIEPGPPVNTQSLKRVKFDVLPWTMGFAAPGACISISEEFQSRYDNRKKWNLALIHIQCRGLHAR